MIKHEPPLKSFYCQNIATVVKKNEGFGYKNPSTAGMLKVLKSSRKCFNQLRKSVNHFINIEIDKFN